MGDSVEPWLGNLGLEQYAGLFADSHISTDELPDLTYDDLRDRRWQPLVNSAQHTFEHLAPFFLGARRAISSCGQRGGHIHHRRRDCQRTL